MNQAIQVFEKRGAGRDLGIARNNFGVLRRSQKRYEESRQILESAVLAIEGDAGVDHPALARVLNNLGITYHALHRQDDAERVFLRSIAVARSRLGVENPLYGVMLHNYADFLRETGRKGEAKTLEAQSRAVLHDSMRRNGAGMTVDVSAFRRK